MLYDDNGDDQWSVKFLNFDIETFEMPLWPTADLLLSAMIIHTTALSFLQAARSLSHFWNLVARAFANEPDV